MRHPACRANEASRCFACLAPGRTPKAIVARTSQAWKTFDASALRRRQRRKRSASRRTFAPRRTSILTMAHGFARSRLRHAQLENRGFSDTAKQRASFSRDAILRILNRSREMIGSFSPVRLPYIVIVGCGRSGTKYTAKLFCDLGIGVGHERLGKEGIASWVLSGEHGKSPWGPKMAALRGIPLKIAHQVRHPLKTISSVMTAKPRSWKFIAQNIACDRDRLLRCSMQYWLYWNELSEEKAGYTYPVEKLDEGISELLRYCERSVENAQIEYAL